MPLPVVGMRLIQDHLAEELERSVLDGALQSVDLSLDIPSIER